MKVRNPKVENNGRIQENKIGEFFVNFWKIFETLFIVILGLYGTS